MEAQLPPFPFTIRGELHIVPSSVTGKTTGGLVLLSSDIKQEVQDAVSEGDLDRARALFREHEANLSGNKRREIWEVIRTAR